MNLLFSICTGTEPHLEWGGLGNHSETARLFLKVSCLTKIRSHNLLRIYRQPSTELGEISVSKWLIRNTVAQFISGCESHYLPTRFSHICYPYHKMVPVIGGRRIVDGFNGFRVTFRRGSSNPLSSWKRERRESWSSSTGKGGGEKKSWVVNKRKKKGYKINKVKVPHAYIC